MWVWWAWFWDLSSSAQTAGQAAQERTGGGEGIDYIYHRQIPTCPTLRFSKKGTGVMWV